MSEVLGVLTADPQGAVIEETVGSPNHPAQSASAVAATVHGFTAAGSTAGLSRLEMLLVRGAHKSSVAAVRPDALLLVTVDPAKATGAVEKAMQAWASEAASSTTATAGPPATVSSPPAEALARPAEPIESVAPSPAESITEAVGVGPAETAAPAPAHAGETACRPSGGDAWGALRRALVRGQLTKASVHRRELADPSRSITGRPGSEVLSAEQHERAMQVLLEGIGTVIAGDGIGGSRILRELTAESQRNLSMRWLALQWSASAALRSGSASVARSHVKEALTLARQLDIDARAVSQWTAAEVLAQGGDHVRALTWLTEARARFERMADRWGLGRAWLAEARIMAANQRDQEAAAAARKAWAVDPDWDEPPIFLARRALMGNDLAEAESIVRALNTPSAERVRTLITAIREGLFTQADASEFLREHDAPPSTRALRALERIAYGSPRFLQARDALAWMLLKLGRYADASAIFRDLLAEDLSPGDRASAMLGLGCIPAELQAGAPPAAPPGAAASEATPFAAGSGDAPAPVVPSLGSDETGIPSAVFSGRLSVFALPDLLEFLRSARRTGLLVCSSTAGIGTLRLREGRITAAASPGTPKLGQILVRDGKVASQALETVAARQASTQAGRPLGEMLVQEGLVEASVVQEALAQQIGLTIRELVHWKDGEFAFNEFAFSRDGESLAASRSVKVELDAQAVLLSVFKEIDEAARVPTSDVEL
jgi:tetratricopeptide (TPR) repeat protein